MLNKEEIKELLNVVEQGEKALKLLNEHSDLVEQKRHLENIKSSCNNCRKLTIEQGHNRNVEFKINSSYFALEQINKIIDNEIKFIDNKLDNLN